MKFGFTTNDFQYCPSGSRGIGVISLEDSIHELKDVKCNDAIRENHLKSLGLKFIFFKNEDVLYNLENVLIQVKQTIHHGR